MVHVVNKFHMLKSAIKATYSINLLYKFSKNEAIDTTRSAKFEAILLQNLTTFSKHNYAIRYECIVCDLDS